MTLKEDMFRAEAEAARRHRIEHMESLRAFDRRLESQQRQIEELTERLDKIVERLKIKFDELESRKQ